MIAIVFKNLNKSVYVKELVIERLNTIIERFPFLLESKIRATVSMDNSPLQAGLDSFSVKVHVSGGKYHGIILKKSSSNFYSALSDLVDHMLERLNRFSDKNRVKNIKDQRTKTKNSVSI